MANKKSSNDETTARAIIEACGPEFSAMLTLAVERARKGLDPVEFTAKFDIAHPPEEVSYNFAYQAKPKGKKSALTSVKLKEGPLTEAAEAADNEKKALAEGAKKA